MFNVGTPELLVILLVALIVLGPNKLPDAARQVGKYMGEFRRMSSGFQNELRDAMQEPVSSVKETLKGDPVPKATPAASVKPVSQVIDQSLVDDQGHDDQGHDDRGHVEQLPDESAAADPSSASLGGPTPDDVDDHAGDDDEAAASLPEGAVIGTDDVEADHASADRTDADLR